MEFLVAQRQEKREKEGGNVEEGKMKQVIQQLQEHKGEIHRIVKEVQSLVDPYIPEMKAYIPLDIPYLCYIYHWCTQSTLSTSYRLDPKVELMIELYFERLQGNPIGKVPPTLQQQLIEYCKEGIQYHEACIPHRAYISRCIQQYCPNVAQLLGIDLAAIFIGEIGSIVTLANSSSETIRWLGHEREERVGKGRLLVRRKAGYILDHPLVQEAPIQYQMNIIRKLITKTLLVARIDSYGKDKEGSKGKVFYDQIKAYIDQVIIASKLHPVNALPAPKLLPKKRRGGAKARRMKKRMEVTPVDKLMNRVSFNQPEHTYGLEEKGMGQLTPHHSKLVVPTSGPLSYKMKEKLKKYSD